MASTDKQAFLEFCRTVSPKLIRGNGLDDDVFSYILNSFDVMDDKDDKDIILIMGMIKSYEKKMGIKYFNYCYDLFTYVTRHELKNRYYDTIILLGKSALYNFNLQSGIELINGLEGYFSDDFHKKLLQLIKGFFHYNDGKYHEYEEIIKEVKQYHNTKDYIFIPLSTSLDFDIQTVNGRSDVQTLFLMPDYSLPKEAEYVICASCDEVYFKKYSKYFLDSFHAASAGKSGIFAHITILMKEKDAKISSQFIDDMRQKNIYITIVNTGPINNMGPLASAYRLIDAYHINKTYNCDVATVDFDAFFIEIPDYRDSTYDITVREIKNVFPWEKYAAGFTFYRNNESMKAMLSYMFRHINYYYRPDVEQWWIDQNAIEAAIRTLKKEKVELFMADIRHDLHRQVLLPTGSENIKMRLLNERYKPLAAHTILKQSYNL